MKAVSSQSSEAPVEYRSIHPIYQAARSTAWALWAITCWALYLSGQWELGWTIGIEAVLIALHALWTRNKAVGSMERTHTIDAFGAATFFLAGLHPATLGGAIFYLIFVPFLLLPPRRVRPIVARVALIIAPAMAASLLFDLSRPIGVPPELITIAMDLLALGIIATLCSVAFANIRRLRTREASALAAERKASAIKDEFVAMVSHELRTPLTGIVGFAGMLRESWHDLAPGEVDELLQLVSDESQHLERLVEDILAIPRLDTESVGIEPALVEIRPVFEQVAALVFPGAAGDKVTIEIPSVATAWVDPDRVRQIATNLLENARKYGGNHVTIEGSFHADKYMVVVADNGPGIPEDDRERIFVPFEQLDQDPAFEKKGLGLGLPIARKVIRAMGGDMWVEAAEPTGCRFCFTMILGPAYENIRPKPLVAVVPVNSNRPSEPGLSSGRHGTRMVRSPVSNRDGKARHLAEG